MKLLWRLLALVLVVALLAVLVLPFVTRASEISDESKTSYSVPDSLDEVSSTDSDTPVEEAAPDYWVIVKIVLGVVIGGLVIYILVKPKKKSWE